MPVSANQTSSGNVADSSTEELHRLCKGTYEICKSLGYLIFSLDILPGLYIALYVFGFAVEKSINPIVLLFLALTAMILKIILNRYRQKADSMRRISAYNYSFGLNTLPSVYTTFKREAPVFVNYFAKRVPTENLNEYYEPSFGPGPTRYREIYAHSAFFTWDLQKSYSNILIALFLILVTTAVSMFYINSTTNLPLQTRFLNASTICSVLIILFIFRCFEGLINAKNSADVSKMVSDKLLKNDLKPDEINSIIMEYEFERATGELVPTFFYKLFRNSLKTDWDILKQEIKEPEN